MAGKNFIADIRALIEGDAADLPPRHESRRQLDKWRLIHKHVHDHPFPTNRRLGRAEQWRAADNLERGVQDMRPRKNGSCHALLMDYIGDRKRQAMAVHKWLLAADENSTATGDGPSEHVLDRHRVGDAGGAENF